MNGTNRVEPIEQTFAAGVAFPPVTASVVPGLVLSDNTMPGMNTKDTGRSYTVILAKAFHCTRDAQREERNGFPYTAAMMWRSAAELFAPDTRAAECCWCEWERIMQLPRRLADQPALFRRSPE